MLPKVRSRAGTPTAADFVSADGSPLVQDDESGAWYGYAANTVYQIATLNVVASGAVGDGVTDNVGPFQDAIAKLRALGGGVLRVPVGTYLFDVDAEADCLLIDFDDFKLEAEPGTVFKWDYYGLPLIAVIGANSVEISGIHFQWTGTRGANPASSNHFGYDGTGVISQSEWCCHVAVGGSNYVWLHNLSWDGATTSNTLEIGISLWNGTSAGPTSDTANVVGNVIENIDSNDVYFGITAMGQDQFRFSNWQSDRYISAQAHVGPGHFFYSTGRCTNGIIENFVDKGTAIDTIAVSSCWSFQFRYLNKCIVRNMRSSRIPGLCSILNDTNDNIFENFSWSAERYADETNLVDVSAVVMAQASTTHTMSRNVFRNWYLNDLKNTGGGRSANCGFVSQGGQTYRAPNALNNSFENITIVFTPGGAYANGVFDIFGTSCAADVVVINNGVQVKQQMRILGDDATRLAENNIVRIRLAGTQSDPYISTTNGDNNLIVASTTSAAANLGTISAGDTLTIN